MSTAADTTGGDHEASVNIPPAERAARVLGGALVAVAGIVLLASADSALAVELELLLVAAGLDLVVTGALGHCPLYRALGRAPVAARSLP